MYSEKIINQPDRKIYLPNEKSKSISELLSKIFGNDTGTMALGAVTYRDEKYIYKQCHSDARRSIDDIYLIVRTYFPDATLKEILIELLSLRIKKYRIHLSYCSTINKKVVHFYSLPAKWQYMHSKTWKTLLKENEIGKEQYIKLTENN